MPARSITLFGAVFVAIGTCSLHAAEPAAAILRAGTIQPLTQPVEFFSNLDSSTLCECPVDSRCFDDSGVALTTREDATNCSTEAFACREPEDFWSDLDRVAAESKTFGKRFANVEYQMDTRGFNVFHAMGATPLPFGVRLFGFADLNGVNTAHREDLAEFYFELNLSRKIWRDVGLIVEVNDFNVANNAQGLGGVFFRPTWPVLSENHATLICKALMIEGDSQSWQFSFVWSKRFPELFDDRFSAGCDRPIRWKFV